MQLAVILIIVFALALLATGAGLALSRRRINRLEEPPGPQARGTGTAVLEPPAAPPAAPPEAPPVTREPPILVEPPVVAPEPPVVEPPVAEPVAPPVAPPVALPARPRLRDRLGKARALLSGYVGDLRSRDKIDDETWDDLEEALIRADVGVATTTRILDDMRRRVKDDRISTPDQLIDLLKSDMVDALGTADRTLVARAGEMNVWMFVGVNGVGKTTTIGKLGQRAVSEGSKVVMAAADTFRAAAAEQLELWGQRVGADVVRGQEGADPGSIVFDAMGAATNRSADLVLVDTAGRLHTKVNLMEELKKLRRIVDRTPGALKEVLLVIDASTGQNGLVQAKQFADAVDVTGVVLTKLDGTAKGGIVLAIQQELGIPVKVVGVGESASDLVEFDPQEFIDALFS
jgi:fused signal recognition particle receptor